MATVDSLLASFKFIANLSLFLFLSEYIHSLKIITLLKNPRRNLNTNLMKKRTIVKSMAITTRMSRTAHIAKVKKVTKTVKVTKEAKMARVASVKEVSRLVSVVANDNENQPKMAFSGFLGINCIFTHKSSEYLFKIFFLFLFISLVFKLDFNHSNCPDLYLP